MGSPDAEAEFLIMVQDDEGNLLALSDADGSRFKTEKDARQHLEWAAAEYPKAKPYIARCHIVNLDGDPEPAPADVAPCPAVLPEDIRASLLHAALSWRDSDQRPRVSPSLVIQWNQLLEEWAHADDLPLLVRKARGTRGQIVVHASGRAVVPVDNTPAHWVLRLALGGTCPDLALVRRLFADDAVPIAMAMSAAERAAARYTGSNAKWPGRLNDLGWKVCHAVEIGLRSRTQLVDQPMEKLVQHFRSLMSPSNMFLVPLAWAGFGELSDVREVFAGAFESNRPE